MKCPEICPICLIREALRFDLLTPGKERSFDTTLAINCVTIKTFYRKCVCL